MHLYTAHITNTGEELCVAARTPHHGAEVLATFWIARTGAHPGRFFIKEGPPSTYEDNLTLEIIAQGDASGVIVRQTDGSLHFDVAIGR